VDSAEKNNLQPDRDGRVDPCATVMAASILSVTVATTLIYSATAMAALISGATVTPR